MDSKQFKLLLEYLERIAVALEARVEGSPCVFCGKAAKTKIKGLYVCLDCYREKTSTELEAMTT